MADYLPANPNAQQSVRNVLNYLRDIEGNGIVVGQHTQTREQEELEYIADVTGKLPALCGFELLAYSTNINRADATEACLIEVDAAADTLEQAWQWADRKGLITFTWHWFSPRGGRDKSFYTAHTAFDARRALRVGTTENAALIAQMDKMAKLLKPFAEKEIPILWRPFHESEGTWFWWGARGPDVARSLWRVMFDRYTKYHHLDNLIWVWNSHLPEGYVGDDYCDIISRDPYLERHVHSDYKEQYHELIKITDADKITALGEVGPIVDVPALAKSRVPWAFFMTWSKEWLGYETTTVKVLRQAYNDDYAITLAELPELY